MKPTHYEILGVPVGATADQIRVAYRRLAREHHPDRPRGSARRMQAINEAFAVLGNDRRRQAYDVSLRSVRTPAPAGGATSHPTDNGRTPPPEASSAHHQPASGSGRSRPAPPPGARPYRGGSSKLVSACRSQQAGTVARLLAVAPTILFAVSLVVGVIGMMLTSRALLGVAFLLFSLSALAMVSAALLELARSSAGGR